MQNRYLGAKAAAHPVDDLRGQGNLGNQHQGGLPLFQCTGNCLQVNLSLPAARHPLEQESLTLLVINSLINRLDNFLLVGVQGQRLLKVVIVDGLGVRISVHLNGNFLQPALLGPLVKRTNPQLAFLLGIRLLDSLPDDALQV